MHDGDSPEETWDVFLSFATADERHAEELKERLESQGWKVFLAHKSVQHGARWRQRIPRALMNSRLVAVLLSERSAEALYQDSEIIHAIQAKKHGEVDLVPVNLEGRPDSLPSWGFGLEGYQSLDLSQLSMGEAADLLGGRLTEVGEQERGKVAGWEPGYSSLGRQGKRVKFSMMAMVTAGVLGVLLGWSWPWMSNLVVPKIAEGTTSEAEDSSPLDFDSTEEQQTKEPRPEMIRIPGGTFKMGDPYDGLNPARPVHEVTVASFEMSKTEVTMEQYRACVRDGGCDVLREQESCSWGVDEKEDHPINCISWEQAKAYAEWLGLRLPSEAEWEYAARSGGLFQDYPWGDAEPTCQLAVNYDCVPGTMPVCSKMDGNTKQGLCDMAGNVSEWVEDDWHRNYLDSPNDGSARIYSPRVSERVFRGSSWRSSRVRVVIREKSLPSSSSNHLGFRVARSLPSSG